MIYRKAQSAVEFIILVGIVLVVFLIFMGVIQRNISDEVKNNRDTVAKEIALTIQNELSLASEASDGYFRKFTLPANILGLDYDIILTDTNVFIKTVDEKHAVALPISNVTGNAQAGDNIIKNVNGEVFVNS